MPMGMLLMLDSQPNYPRRINNAGKDLVEHDEALTEAAEMLGVRPLTDFCSQSRADALSEYGGEEGVQAMEAAGYSFPAEQQWFSPTEGLKTVVALKEYVEANPAVPGEDAEEDETLESVVTAFQDIEELLQDAEKKQRRFYLTYH